MSHALGFSEVTVPIFGLDITGSGRPILTGATKLTITVSTQDGKRYLDFLISGKHPMLGGISGHRLPIRLKDQKDRPLRDSQDNDILPIQFANPDDRMSIEIGNHDYVEVWVGGFFDDTARHLVTLNIPR